MKARGKVLRNPHLQPGLLIVEGRQYAFGAEGDWKSEAPPQPGLDVEVEFDRTGHIRSIAVVNGSQVTEKQVLAVKASSGEAAKGPFGGIRARLRAAYAALGLGFRSRPSKSKVKP